MWEPIPQSHQNGSALTYDHGRNLLVPEIVHRLLEEQANTISKVKLNKIGFRVLKNFIGKEEINIHKLIQN